MEIVGAIDLTGEANLDMAVETVKEVAARYHELGLDFERPLMVVVENLPIMGATEPAGDVFRLHIGAHAVNSGMLDGLVAHEMGHMFLMASGHPSHLHEVHSRILGGVALVGAHREGFFAVAHLAINHIEDIYADDLAFQMIRDDRAGLFFSNWVRRSSVTGNSKWATVANEVTVAFGLGNMERHGIRPEDILLRETEDFTRRGGLRYLPEITGAYRDLPRTGDLEEVEDAIRGLLAKVKDEGTDR